MDRFLKDMECDIRAMSPLTLAYVGDCVFELLVRERLVCIANRPVNDLHKLSVAQVRADAQADAVRRILPELSEAEEAVFKRGRNARTGHTPKNQTESDYHYATGLEALFGYWYLKGETERLREVFALIADGEVQP